MAVGRWRKDDELHAAQVDADVVAAHVQRLAPGVGTLGALAFVQDMALPAPVQHRGVLLA